MATSSVDEKITVEVTPPALTEQGVTLKVMKIWGSLDIRHRGQVLGGGMTWQPKGELSILLPIKEQIDNNLTVDGLKEMFADLVGSLLPSVRVFCEFIDEGKDDF